MIYMTFESLSMYIKILCAVAANFGAWDCCTGPVVPHAQRVMRDPGWQTCWGACVLIVILVIMIKLNVTQAGYVIMTFIGLKGAHWAILPASFVGCWSSHNEHSFSEITTKP